MDKTYLERPLAELIEQYPEVENFLFSLNLRVMDRGKTMGQLLAAASYNDFLDASMGREDIVRSFLLLLARLERPAEQNPAAFRTLTVLPGRDKDGAPEQFTLTAGRGEVICLVGPTGSGKSRLLEDIEYLADGDTPTGRRMLLDGKPPDPAWRCSADNRVVAQLSQNMNFVMDLSVREFLLLHAGCRRRDAAEAAAETLACANALSGEAFDPDTSLTRLSGGQSRALMIADTAVLSDAPVVLIDEIENAGVDRQQALSLLLRQDKIVFVSTHDPVLALLGQRRLVFRNGAVCRVIATSPREQANLAVLSAYSRRINELRERLRQGLAIEEESEKLFAGL